MMKLKPHIIECFWLIIGQTNRQDKESETSVYDEWNNKPLSHRHNDSRKNSLQRYVAGILLASVSTECPQFLVRVSFTVRPPARVVGVTLY